MHAAVGARREEVEWRAGETSYSFFSNLSQFELQFHCKELAQRGTKATTLTTTICTVSPYYSEVCRLAAGVVAVRTHSTKERESS